MSSRTETSADLGVVEFAPRIEQVHQRIQPSHWDQIYIVGDVHGCIDELELMLEQLSVGSDDLVVFVGDLVRKGPDSAAVVERVRSTPNLTSIRGNNEQKVIDGTDNPGLDADAIDYLADLPLVISIDGDLVVHGGINLHKPLTEQTQNDLLEHRYVPKTVDAEATYWFERYDQSSYVFFGHTVLDDPLVTNGAVGLDTGCVHGHGLSVYDWTNERLHQIPSQATYKHRDEDSIVSIADLGIARRNDTVAGQ